MPAKHVVGLLCLGLMVSKRYIVTFFDRGLVGVANLLKEAPVRVWVELGDFISPRRAHVLIHVAGIDALSACTQIR